MANPTLDQVRVLVTGGAGLIGSHLIDLLATTNAKEIIIFDNLSRGQLKNLSQATASGKPVRFIQGDIRDRSQLATAFEGIDLVYHLAAIRLTQCAEDPRLALEVMADGTFNVLEAAVAHQVKRVVAASSSSIYGLAEQFPTPETHHPYHNTTIYGAAKVFNEGLLASFRAMYDLDYVAFRPFNVYGPRMDTQGAYTEVLIRWIDRIDRGLPPIIFGDGQQSMDFIFVEDVARAFFLGATAEVSGEVFNLASGVETSLKDLAETLLRVMDSDLAIEYGPERKLSNVPRRLGGIERAKERLGFEAKVSLEEGLRRLVHWWQHQRSATNPATTCEPASLSVTQP
ncbi:SDR family NAD(P)-dependent oxidoreductase [Nostoc sp.]|uniref:SDR family NAD(P)-dependent oxidoreductase n=1 Tax=Nostoc sp. TaxID=1180 RepID=UPI002FFD2254